MRLMCITVDGVYSSNYNHKSIIHYRKYWIVENEEVGIIRFFPCSWRTNCDNYNIGYHMCDT